MTMPPGFPVQPPKPQAHSAAEVDTETPSTARIYDYLLGGKDNYDADRAAAARVEQAIPDVRAQVRANREFLRRAVRFIAGQGVDQFMDLGTGIPTQGPTHEVAHEVRPDARVAYVDNDPVVLVHARALLKGDGVGYVDHDLRDATGMLAEPEMRRLIDFTRPVGVLLIAVAHFIEDADRLIDTVMDAVPSGSWLAITAANDAPEIRRAVQVYEDATSRAVARSVEQIQSLFHGVDLVAPGVVPLHDWRPDAHSTTQAPMLYGGVGIKP